MQFSDSSARHVRQSVLSAAAMVGSLLAPPRAQAQPQPPRAQAQPQPPRAQAQPQGADTEAASLSKPLAGVLWGVAQLIPSPLVATDGQVAQGGLRWQLTPVLYSFGIAARPWRSFIVAPMARLSGSLEIFVAPEWTCCAGGDKDGILLRAGGRAYLPLLEHGESLAGSLGASYWRSPEAGGPSFDLGLYTLFGTLGLVATVSPGLAGRQFSLALSIRYF